MSVLRTKMLSASLGAIVCESVAALARQCPVLFTIVSDDAALKSICEGGGGLLQNMAPGGIHISLTTILPETAKELAALHWREGQHYLASPVFGRPEAAVARKLNYILAGPGSIKKKVEPLLKDSGGLQLWDFGESITAANTVKLCGNFLIAAALEAIGESVALANRSGVDAARMWELFNQTLFNTPLYHNYSKLIVQQKFEPAAFTMQLGLKDMNLVLQQAATVQQAMPLAALLQQHMMQLVGDGKQNMDWSAISFAAR